MPSLPSHRNTLSKSERICSQRIIQQMFSGGATSFSLYPLRVVFIPVEEQDASAAILVSVSKHRFKRAVKRNRVKRQIREAYRKNKHQLIEAMATRQLRVAIAFIYLADRLMPSSLIEERMITALARICEKTVSQVAKEVVDTSSSLSIAPQPQS